jgi:hypothetical protein
VKKTGEEFVIRGMPIVPSLPVPPPPPEEPPNVKKQIEDAIEEQEQEQPADSLPIGTEANQMLIWNDETKEWVLLDAPTEQGSFLSFDGVEVKWISP